MSISQGGRRKKAYHMDTILAHKFDVFAERKIMLKHSAATADQWIKMSQ